MQISSGVSAARAAHAGQHGGAAPPAAAQPAANEVAPQDVVPPQHPSLAHAPVEQAAPGGLVRSQGAFDLAARAQGNDDIPDLPRAGSPDPEICPVAPEANADTPAELPRDVKSARQPQSPPSPDDEP